MIVKIAPSILSADFNNLGSEIHSIEPYSDFLHFDIMDGVFVPNISMGIPVLKAIRKTTNLFIDAHLMISTPEKFAKAFCDAGADLLDFHVESASQDAILNAIRIAKASNVKTGIAIRPTTPVSAVLPFIDQIDLVLVMTVEPGFAGQSFLMSQLTKIKDMRALINQYNPNCDLEVDGGINLNTAKAAANAGANVLVAGSTIFSSDNRKQVIEMLRRIN